LLSSNFVCVCICVSCSKKIKCLNNLWNIIIKHF
jgi:hypothetical protein